MSPNPQPMTWADCIKLVDDPELFRLLRARLVFLAFTQTTAVAPKAIEMLFEAGQDAAADDLSNIPTNILEAARSRALVYLRTLEQNSLPTDYTNQSGGFADE